MKPNCIIPVEIVKIAGGAVLNTLTYFVKKEKL